MQRSRFVGNAAICVLVLAAGGLAAAGVVLARSPGLDPVAGAAAGSDWLRGLPLPDAMASAAFVPGAAAGCAAAAIVAMTGAPAGARGVTVGVVGVLAVAGGVAGALIAVAPAPSQSAAAAAAGCAAGVVGARRVRALSRHSAYGDELMIGSAEIARPKTSGDRWVLIVGPHGAGKSALVSNMLRHARRWSAAPQRRGRADGIAVVEARLTAERGAGTLRLWEYDGGDSAGLPAPELFDAAIVVVDPARHAGSAETLPEWARSEPPADANDDILRIDALAPSARVAWVVVSKVDTLRYSIAPGMVESAALGGREWRDRLETLNVSDRRRLAEAMGLDAALREHDGWRWGTGHPLVSFEGRSGGEGAFGGREAMMAVLDAMWPPAAGVW